MIFVKTGGMEKNAVRSVFLTDGKPTTPHFLSEFYRASEDDGTNRELRTREIWLTVVFPPGQYFVRVCEGVSRNKATPGLYGHPV